MTSTLLHLPRPTDCQREDFRTGVDETVSVRGLA
jgi:hypothetical protein